MEWLRSRRIYLVAGVIALVGAASWLHDRIEDRTIIWTDATVLECDNTTVEAHVTDDGTILAARLEPAMRCLLSFTIANDTGLDVTIGSISMPGAGPTANPGFVATALSPQINELVDAESSGPAARWEVGDPLAAGESIDYQITIEFREGGCTAEGISWVAEWPIVEVKSWGMTVTVPSEAEPVGFLGTQHTSC